MGTEPKPPQNEGADAVMVGFLVPIRKVLRLKGHPCVSVTIVCGFEDGTVQVTGGYDEDHKLGDIIETAVRDGLDIHSGKPSVPGPYHGTFIDVPKD